MKKLKSVSQITFQALGGTAALLALTSAFFSISTAVAASPLLGHETIPADEASATETVTSMILKSLQDQHGANPNTVVQRDAHPKAHGCVKAEFEVLPELAKNLSTGLFSQPAKYKAWIRFSNGSPGDNPDSKGDGRGMAIKVLGVPGAKILPNDETLTQDFLMINHPVFFVRNASDYISFQKSPLLFLGTHPLHEGLIALQTTRESITNPFQAQYWSMAPYRLGADAQPGSSAQAIKYSAVPTPCEGERIEHTETSPSRNFLRNAMIITLHKTDVCFKLQVQLQTDAKTMPIEDPTLSWDDAGAPYTTVAMIRIKKSDNDGKLGLINAKRTTFCENIAMSPWHSLPEHRPLGGINRVRKSVYQAISTYRREANGVAAFEPTGDETF